MRTEVARIGKNRVELEVEVGQERLDEAMEKAYRRVVSRVNIPGFRKGKAPRAILERFVGKAPLYEEAVEALVPKAFQEAISEKQIEPIDEPEFDVVQLEEGKPFIFKATVDVKPEVKLGEYKGLEVTVPKIVITEDQIDHVLQDLRLRHSELVESDRKVVQNDDYVLIDFEGFLDGEPFAGGAARDYLLHVGSGEFVPGFEEQLVGASVGEESAGEEREVRVTFPGDYREKRLAGREVSFKVNVKAIKERRVPELDDSLAREVGPFDTLDALREDVRSHLAQEAERESRKNVEDAVVDKAAAEAEVEPPDVLVDREVEERLQDFKSALSYRGMQFEAYLAEREASEDEVRAELRPAAADSVKKRLMLEAIAKAEEIEVTDNEIEDRASALATAYGHKDAENMKERLLSPGRKEIIRADIAVGKAIRLMADSAKVTEVETTSEAGHGHGAENH